MARTAEIVLDGIRVVYSDRGPESRALAAAANMAYLEYMAAAEDAAPFQRQPQHPAHDSEMAAYSAWCAAIEALSDLYPEES